MNELQLVVRPQTRFELDLIAKVNTLEQLNQTLLIATTTYQLRMVEQDMQIEKQGGDIAFLKGVISEQALLLDTYAKETQILLGRLEFAQEHVGKSNVADRPEGYEPPADFFGEGVA